MTLTRRNTLLTTMSFALLACTERGGDTDVAAPQTETGTQFVTSADGTRIAYTRTGQGPAIVLVGGMLSDRRASRPLAEALSGDFTVYNFDRRGRGESTDTPPYAVQREIEDIAAVQQAAGGEAVLYGHSSGAGLALEAVASGLAVPKLILHEPPYTPADEQSRARSAQAATAVRQHLDAGRSAEAIESFMTYAGAPPEIVAQAAADPATQRMTPTMLYDFAIMDTDGGGALQEAKARALQVDTLVLSGTEGADFFQATCRQIASLAAHAECRILEGQGHAADPAVLAPAIHNFAIGV